MNTTVLFWFAFSVWLAVVLTGCSYMAMGIELRWRGIPVKWWSFSFDPRKRIETFVTVKRAYQTFKQERSEPPVFLWSMGLFGAAIAIVPLIALIYTLVLIFG